MKYATICSQPEIRRILPMNSGMTLMLWRNA